MNNRNILLIGLLILIAYTGCQPKHDINVKGMIKVSIFYPNAAGKTFDMNYYLDKHIPLVDSVFGDALKKVAIDRGLEGGSPNSAAPNVVICHLYFKSKESYQKILENNAEKFAADFPKYTNIKPVVQISEVIR
ncbi:EthD family reductase [Sphingobacterium sp. SRCM116780]|uniref:EthD family reductase n=1 Tax=Sphingobacterium sp. SRCM116780 TaxID=2907623 RepID=UPI001F1CA380|nr:EthD family reductase [Sphingobacterium sp. SRCM116780]UIR57001.1 EthD family reductase [Sphingobacterium sp. SRCM116780]